VNFRWLEQQQRNPVVFLKRPVSSATCDKRIAPQASQRDKPRPAAEVLGLTDSSDDAPNAATRQAYLNGDFHCRAFSIKREPIATQSCG
jgi:hypothetical protein